MPKSPIFSIYHVHKKIGFFTPSPVRMRPHEPDPLPSWTSTCRGVHPSEAMMHFPPVSDFPPIFEKFSDSVEILPFPEKFLDFHPPKFLMTFFSRRPQILNSPIFPVAVHFPSVSRKLLFPPNLKNFPLF